MNEIERIRRVRREMSLLLHGWALGSIAVGALAMVWAGGTGGVAGAAGVEFVVWGAIDAWFAVSGLRQARRVDATPPTPADPAELADAAKVMKALRVNAVLNWVWLAMAGGLLVWAFSAHSGTLFGHGIGVGVQGGMLFWFDRAFQRRLGAALVG